VTPKLPMGGDGTDGAQVSRRRQDPRSRKRAGRQVREVLRTESLAAARAHRSHLAIIVLGWALTAGTLAYGTRLLGGSDYAIGFNVGVFVGLLPFLWLTFLVGRGISHRSMGADAEEWTAEELAKLDKQRWTVFHDVPLERSNIDHVVVGPGRVYAVETKWTARDDLDRFLRGASHQASRQAKELAQVLAQRGARREVIPLLVVWGPGVVGGLGARPRLEGDVRAVSGANAEDWLSRMNGAADRLETDWPAQRVLETYVREHEQQT
jgi:hypothetical protein